MKAKRYLIFAGADYYPAGGWGDFVGDFDTLEEAIAKAKTLGSNWKEIIDLMDIERNIDIEKELQASAGHGRA